MAGVTTSTASALAKTGPVSVAYVEVNSNSMLNVGKYSLANGSGNVFDIGVIFAANINYDVATRSAYLFFNPNVQRVLDNVATQVRPLQAKGIKVMLSILGNHQGAGFANEFAEYGNNSTGQPNASSFVYLVSALRAAMPSKLITLYNIGPSASRLSFGGVDITSKFSYAWNPFYGTWGVPNIALPKAKLSPAAIQINATPTSTVTSLARRTVSEGYGVYLTYNLGAPDAHTYISAFTRELYGTTAVFTG
jgi:hypothetical protein